MEGIQLVAGNPLGLVQGVTTLIGLGVAMLVLANFTRAKLVKNTHDFVIAGLLSVWTWGKLQLCRSGAAQYGFKTGLTASVSITKLA